MFLFRFYSQLFFIFTLIFVQSAWSQSSDAVAVNYCIDPNWAPYESTQNDQHIGISKQYFNLIEQKTSLTFNLIETKDWQQSLAFVKSGQCQLLPMLNKSPVRDTFLTFSNIYFRAPNALYGHYDQKMLGNLSAISTQTVAVVAQYRMFGYLNDNYPNMNIIAVKNEEEGLTRVENKEIDYFVGSFYSANKIIQDAFLTNLRIVGIAEVEDNLRIGVNKQSEYLLPYLNEAIAKLTEQDHQQVFSYFKVLNTVKHTDYTFAIRIAIFGGIIIFILLIGYRRSLHYSNKLVTKNSVLKKLHHQLDEKNQLLAELAIRDPLTNLYNRSHLSEVISQQINLKNRYNKNACLLMIDIDNFKTINDTLGHSLGDDILKYFAMVLTECAREVDIVARWGGEEFVLLCPETEMPDALRIAERFQQSLIEFKNDNYPNVTCSIGIAALSGESTADEWFILADNAMYKAKAQGKNSIFSLPNEPIVTNI